MIISDMHHRIRLQVHICKSVFSKIRLADRSVKTVNTYLFANNRKLHKFATCNSIIETKLVSDEHNPDVDI